jgi:hypothetical protein
MNGSSGYSSSNSPTMNKQFMFDLSSTNFDDLASDQNAFNSFYSGEKTSHVQEIERP